MIIIVSCAFYDFMFYETVFTNAINESFNLYIGEGG